MARVARLKAEHSGDVFYHLYSRVAGVSGYYPLGQKLARAGSLGTLFLWLTESFDVV